MVMADVFAVVFSFLALFVGMLGFWMVVRGLWPRMATQAALRFRHTPLRTLPVGMMVAPFLFAPGLFLISVDVGPVKMLGLWWLGATFGLALAGAGGLASRIGDAMAIGDEPDWKRTLKGGAALEMAFLVPLLGWFLLPVVTLLAGIGAATLALVKRLEDPGTDAVEVATLRAA